ncbi:MAG: hypothetical protein HY834_20520 [Devosia nanyangense]|uniref:Uncharacterized protein n=1 Tax=Devosia nanyangense TaxID=1228055 RepID=A0A933P0Y7_9HYPH|nr:hypothetical protein [Devosia nanyangense]
MMTTQRSFGRRGASAARLSTPSRRFDTEIDPRPKRQRWGWGRITLAIVGGLFVLGVVGNLIDDRDPAIQPTTAKAAVSPTSREPCGATLKEYSALKAGMSLHRAASVIGCPGTEMSRVSIGGQETVLVSWRGTRGLFSNMNATFDNDRLVAKGQLGLE